MHSQQNVKPLQMCLIVKILKKYSWVYIEPGFFWTGDREIHKSLCISCVKVIVNGSKEPVKLPRLLET
jgi:hypothetical protein